LQVRNSYPIKNLNAFRVDVETEEFYAIDKIDQLLFLIKEKKVFEHTPLVLGGGYNCLFTKNYSGCLLYNCLLGITKMVENEKGVRVKVASGEKWQNFVDWSVKQGLGGVENLTNIPGTVGAAPIQNIGAYGSEVCNSIVEVEGVDLSSGECLSLSNAECQFSYRHSIFKEKYKDKIFITSVTFELQKNPIVNIQYKDILDVIEKNKLSKEDLSIEFIKKTIANIRAAKLPDPDVIPNAGSFFKNPIVSSHRMRSIRELYPHVSVYDLKNGQYKLSAAWLIDTCGLKGFNHKGAGVHENHALVLVNHSNADGKTIVELSQIIQKNVEQKFGLKLEPEVNFI